MKRKLRENVASKGVGAQGQHDTRTTMTVRLATSPYDAGGFPLTYILPASFKQVFDEIEAVMVAFRDRASKGEMELLNELETLEVWGRQFMAPWYLSFLSVHYLGWTHPSLS